MIIDLGLIDYEDAYRIQKELVARLRLGEIADSVILAEHDHVFTIGRTGRIENLLADQNELKNADAKVIRVDRGGDITYHGPGQLVVYPIIDLRRRSRDLHQYLRDLEEVAINFLKEYSINAVRISGRTGVWIGDRKIASIGVGSTGWITYHGMSININTDLGFFSMINPCGMKDVKMTSLCELIGRYVDMNEAKEKMVARLSRILRRHCEGAKHPKQSQRRARNRLRNPKEIASALRASQ